MPGRMLVVRFEDLCQSPGKEIERIQAFLGLNVDEKTLDQLARLAKTPKSVGRYRRHDWRSDFDAAQLERLAALGYQAD